MLEKHSENLKIEQSHLKREISLLNEDINRRLARLEELHRQLKKNKNPELQVTLQKDIEMTAQIAEEGKSKLNDLSAPPGSESENRQSD